MRFKGCDSNFEVKCSNFNSFYKLNNYLALNNTWDNPLVLVLNPQCKLKMLNTFLLNRTVHSLL